MDKKAVIEKVAEFDQTRDANRRAELLRNLVAQGEEIIPWVLEYAHIPPHYLKSLSVLEILDAFGYPANKQGLPFISSVIANLNNIGWEKAFEMGKRIGEPIIPEIREGVKFCFRDPEYYCGLIEGFCQFLEEVDPKYSAMALPELLEILRKGTDENPIDEYAMWPLGKIGSPQADPAIPLLIGIVTDRERSSRTKADAIKTLQSFRRESLKPYIPRLIESQADSAAGSKEIGDFMAWWKAEDRK